MSETHGTSKKADDAVNGVLTMLHDKGYSMDDSIDVLAMAIQGIMELKRIQKVEGKA